MARDTTPARGVAVPRSQGVTGGRDCGGAESEESPGIEEAPVTLLTDALALSETVVPLFAGALPLGHALRCRLRLAEWQQKRPRRPLTRGKAGPGTWVLC